jgi:HEAT repeat protein
MSSTPRAVIERLAAPFLEVREKAKAELIAAGTEAVPALLEALAHRDPDVRAGAALVLGAMGVQEAAQRIALLATLDPLPKVRPLALRALVDLAGPSSQPVVAKTFEALLGDADLFVRSLSCKGLGNLGDRGATRLLEPCTRDREPWVREAARAALDSLERPRAIAASSTATEAGGPSDAAGGAAGTDVAPHEGPPPSTIGPSAIAKVETGGAPAALDGASTELVAALRSFDLEAQRRAQAALVRIGSGVVPRVAPLIWDPSSSTARAAMELLGEVGGPEAARQLARRIEDPGVEDGLLAIALHALARICEGAGEEASLAFPVEAIERRLESADPYVRAAAASALVAHGGVDRQLGLEAAFVDEASWVRASACRTLARVASEKDRLLIPLIDEILASRLDPGAQVNLLEALRRILSDPTPEDERHLAAALPLLESPEYAVRAAAASLLSRVARSIDRGRLEALLVVLDETPAESTVDLVAAVARLAPREDPAPVPSLVRLLLGRDPPAMVAAARALASIGGVEAVTALVEAANSRAGRVVAEAAQALAAIDPAARVLAIKRPDARWEVQVRNFCSCGGVLRYVTRGGREELRCPECDLEWAIAETGRLFAADRTPFGLCLCPGCRRKRPLVRRGDSEVIVCPASGAVHVRPFDHPRQLHLLSELPLGACGCCAEPQPLIKIDDEVRCYRSQRRYRAAARGFVLYDENAAGLPPPPPGPTEDEVAAINRALLQGTLGIGLSGVAVDDSDDHDR